MPTVNPHSPVSVPVLAPKPSRPGTSSAKSARTSSSCYTKNTWPSSSSNRVRAERTRPRVSVVAGRVHPQVLSPTSAPPKGLAPPITHTRRKSNHPSEVWGTYNVKITGPGSDFAFTESEVDIECLGAGERKQKRSSQRGFIRRKIWNGARPCQSPRRHLCHLSSS